MAVRTALLLALCLLCGAAVARPAVESVNIGATKPREGSDGVRVPSTPAPALSGAETGLKPRRTTSKSVSIAAYTIYVQVDCLCYRGCKIALKFVDGRRRLSNRTYKVRYGNSLYFYQHSDYYFYVNRYRFDPEYDSYVYNYC